MNYNTKSLTQVDILTAIQSTGIPHLGNILSVIIPTIKLTKTSVLSSIIFIADLHSFTQIQNPKLLTLQTYEVAATWLAFGLKINKQIILCRQSDIPEVTELNWYLNCLYPYNRLTLSHSFKDKIQNIQHKHINTGLFTYPILMAADILLYNAKIIPIGKDQLQHIEITRKIAHYFNKKFGNIFTLPQGKLINNFMYIPGIDGKKMSKSRKNTIDIFASSEIIKKQIMSIKTDNKKLKEPKNPNIDLIFTIYKKIANKNKIDIMKNKYLLGKCGYLEAKNILYKCIINKFSKERNKFNFFMQNKEIINKILIKGAKKAKKIANFRLNLIRSYIGFMKKNI